mgnify:CR=1 FL=1
MPIQQRARHRILAGLLDTSFGKSSERNYPNHFVKMSMPLEKTIQIGEINTNTQKKQEKK